MNQTLRNLPAIHELKAEERINNLREKYKISERVLTEYLQTAVDDVRQQIIDGPLDRSPLDREQLTNNIFEKLIDKLGMQEPFNLERVINATGVVLHTNLGRALLSEEALEQLVETSRGYSTLEYEVATNERGSRHRLVEDYLTELTGAEAAIVVNNNAAAVYLILKALAAGQEVIVSRGELVEIGGSFRISEIMAESDAQLVDVGTTNKTHIADYEQALTEETALLMKVHKSNFAIVGFTEEVTADELIPLAKSYNLPVYEDLGSGTLYDFRKHKIGDEPTVQERVAAGIDLISFSGDKLLGGPQAGVIVGKKQYIDQLKSHQLARVLRVDKLTLGSLEATLKAYVRGRAAEEIPTVKHIVKSALMIKRDAEQFVNELLAKETGFTLEVAKDSSKVGGGTMPEVALETYVVRVTHETLSSDGLARELRLLDVPIIVRLQREFVLLDFRTVIARDMNLLVDGFLAVDERARI